MFSLYSYNGKLISLWSVRGPFIVLYIFLKSLPLNVQIKKKIKSKLKNNVMVLAQEKKSKLK